MSGLDLELIAAVYGWVASFQDWSPEPSPQLLFPENGLGIRTCGIEGPYTHNALSQDYGKVGKRHVVPLIAPRIRVNL